VGPRALLGGGSAIVAIGLAGYARLGVHATAYGADVLPPTLVVAAGMALVVAPLTSAVMASVDADHVGAASGFNSALARIGGLIATALLGYVCAARPQRGAGGRRDGRGGRGGRVPSRRTTGGARPTPRIVVRSPRRACPPGRYKAHSNK
jgi:hypothetical protein